MHRTAYAMLTATALFWGGNAVAGKLAVGHISPLLLTSLRWTIALAVLGAFSWRHVRRDWPVIRRHLPLFFFLGVIGFTGFNAALYSALTMTSAINVSIEQAGMPMVVVLINFVLFRLGITWLHAVGFVLSVTGVALTATHGDLTRLAALELNGGDALMLFAVLIYSVYTVFLRFKPALHWQSTITALAVTAMITSLPFAAWEYATGRMVWPDAAGWGVAAYTAIFPSLLAQIFFIRGNELLGGNRASLFINLVPIFGTGLSVLLLGEAFRPYHGLAMVLVLGGIWLAEHSGRNAALRQAARQPRP
ncbi:DMT family transporter [Aquibium sp. A9E412]|uniref:DMT family transporter n=1 Tax=Aquibium sp. A9E412 TaxID=2976767 RepID=UPI0025AFA5B2|nr:DMT family transporter [Aquibium sp. A9E412]MDN2565380.1 DMT family transporter [Aquibium sp. A9E412]